MEWHRAKNILIVLFLFVNIFLLFILIDDNNKASLDKAKLFGVLTQNNITVDLSTIPKAKKRVFVSEFYGVNDEIIHFFIPRILKVDGTTYSDDTKTLIVDRNNISFTDSAPSNDEFRNVTSKNVVSKLEPILKTFGISNYVKVGNLIESSGMYMVEYKYEIDKLEVLHDKLTFLVSNRGLLKCEGALYVPDKKSGYSYDINTPETIIIQSEKKDINITSMKLGLYILDYENALTTQAIPAYQITAESRTYTENRTYTFDARIGVDSKERELK